MVAEKMRSIAQYHETKLISVAKFTGISGKFVREEGVLKGKDIVLEKMMELIGRSLTPPSKGSDGQIFLQCIASKYISCFPQKNVFDKPLSMTVYVVTWKKRSYAITSYLLSLPGGDSRR